MVFQAVGKLLGKHSKMKKKASAETEKLYLEPRYTSARILDADVLMLVALPKGLNVDEWLASNASAFYNHVSLMYGSISEFCTVSSCPTMKAWAMQIQWTDEKGRKRKCSGPQYADYAASIIQKILTDEDLVPTKHCGASLLSRCRPVRLLEKQLPVKTSQSPLNQPFRRHSDSSSTFWATSTPVTLKL
ncbi:MOB kinase activator 2-like isoform X5 [Rana temporaria]|uniref:MOB kinase activator 2-like isoform X5 n=1 Tax=Rana temporaria TaxID=8407 RepID=UPI001AAD7192|nr:MOB kinase activator 2-like isoform X5 [Rana temporaria]